MEERNKPPQGSPSNPHAGKGVGQMLLSDLLATVVIICEGDQSFLRPIAKLEVELKWV